MRMTWQRYAPDASVVAGGLAAILLQVADPVVAAGVAAHSAFERDPVGRLRRTLGYVYSVALGEAPAAGAAAAHVDRAHAEVPGATDPERQRWVAATLVWAGTRTWALCYGRPDRQGLAEVLAGSAPLGTALQLPAEGWFASPAEFGRYWRARLPELEVGADARRVAAALLHPTAAPLWLRAGMPLLRVVTAGILPAEVRRAYDLPWSPARRAGFVLAMASIGLLARAVPRRIRQAPSRMLRR